MGHSEIFTEWMTKAENDLKLAKHITKMDEPDIDNACYHCQQCAEKALKAFLIFSDVQFKFIHNLNFLCSDCQEVDDSFRDLVSHCFDLNRFSSEIRYSSYLRLNTDDMYNAIKNAEDVLSFVKDKTRYKNK